MTKKPLSPEKAQLRMATLCSKSEQCEYRLLKKCREWGLAAYESQQIVDILKEMNFVDDRRYAKAYARDKNLYNGWGRNKIKSYLYADRIKGEYINEALEALDNEKYEEVLLTVARTKARTMDLTLREERQKLVRYLIGRGFLWPEIDGAFKKLKG